MKSHYLRQKPLFRSVRLTRKSMKLLLSTKLNARFWEAITGEEKESLTDQELKKLCLRRACKKLFDKTDALVVADDDGSFVRFTNE